MFDVNKVQQVKKLFNKQKIHEIQINKPVTQVALVSVRIEFLYIGS